MFCYRQGIHALLHAEYDYTSVFGPPERNVRDAKLNLGAQKIQTINSYLTASYDNADIGPGILRVTAGLHKLTLEIVGTNEKSGGCILGLDYVRLVPEK